MKLEKSRAFLLLAVLATTLPVWAEEPGKQTGDSASETGKNEIPVCPKLVPIDVVLNPKYSEADRVEVVSKYEVPKRIEYAVACELERQGYGVAKPFQLKITIKDFRLRSGGSAAMLGIMAGVDKLGVSVDVQLADQNDPLQFDMNTSTAKGGLAMPTPSQRLNSMVQKIAKDVVAMLKKKGLFKEA